jgi:uncharacterized protein (TIGR03067 family)
MRRQGWAVLAVGLLLAADKGKDDPTRRELKKLTGTWTAVSGEDSGKKMPAKDIKGLLLHLADGEFEASALSIPIMAGKFTINTARKPYAMDWKVLEGRARGMTLFLIYEVDRDRLRLCLPDPGKKRPGEFRTTARGREVLIVYKRLKR